MTVSAIHPNMGRAGQIKPHKAKILDEFLKIGWLFSLSCDAQGCPLIISTFSLDPLTPGQHDNIDAWLINPPTLSRATRAHLPITARTKPSSKQEWCLFGPGREILEQIAGASSLVTLSIDLQKNSLSANDPKSILQHLCKLCFAFILKIFLDAVTPDCLCFP